MDGANILVGFWLPVLARMVSKVTGVSDYNIVQNNGMFEIYFPLCVQCEERCLWSPLISYSFTTSYSSALMHQLHALGTIRHSSPHIS